MSKPQPKVEYRQLGKSGLRVSVPIVGAMSFGHSDWAKWVIGEKESIEILKAAWDRGVNTIDTANMYSNGESERVVGKFLKQYNIPREKILIFTKCYFMVGETPGTKTGGLANDAAYVNQHGLSRAAIFNAVNKSLERLDTPYIDLLQIHRFDKNTPVEETMKALHDLVQTGKVRYIGASSMRAWQFAHMNEVARKNGWTTFTSMQDEYSLLYREEEREMIPYCNFHGIGLIPWAPLAGGHLARPLPTDDAALSARAAGAKGTPFERKHADSDQTIINRVAEIAQKRGWSMAQVATAWCASRVASPIVGVNSVARLEEAMVGQLVLTEEESKYLEEPYQPKTIRGHE